MKFSKYICPLLGLASGSLTEDGRPDEMSINAEIAEQGLVFYGWNRQNQTSFFLRKIEWKKKSKNLLLARCSDYTAVPYIMITTGLNHIDNFIFFFDCCKPSSYLKRRSFTCRKEWNWNYNKIYSWDIFACIKIDSFQNFLTFLW